MDFFDVVRGRRSIRAYKDKSVSAELLNKILEAARAAPSAGNLQAYEIVVVREPARKRQLAVAAFGQSFVATAPVVVIFCASPARSASKYGSRGAELYAVQDATIATAYAQLAATALGLGSCWVGAFDESAVARAIGTTDRPVAILPLGWPAEVPRPTPRRQLSELVHEERL